MRRTIALMIVLALYVMPQPALSGEKLSKEMICKAGIATVMGRDPQIMTIDRTQDGIVFLSYNRQDDGSLWTYKCRVDGSFIVWGSDTGRWRDTSWDPTIFYTAKNGKITVTEKFTDGSKNTKKYPLASLK